MTIKIVPLVLFSFSLLFGKDELVICNKIFEERKGELALEIQRLNDKENSLEALREATTKLLNKKNEQLNEQEAGVNKKLADIEAKEKKIESLIAENKKLLEDIEKVKMDKLSNSFSKMKPKSSATILNELDTDEGVKILLNMNPKVISQIFSKMDPKKASELTKKLSEAGKNMDDK